MALVNNDDQFTTGTDPIDLAAFTGAPLNFYLSVDVSTTNGDRKLIGLLRLAYVTTPDEDSWGKNQSSRQAYKVWKIYSGGQVWNLPPHLQPWNPSSFVYDFVPYVPGVGIDFYHQYSDVAIQPFTAVPTS